MVGLIELHDQPAEYLSVWVSGDVGSAIILNESLGWRFGFA